MDELKQIAEEFDRLTSADTQRVPDTPEDIEYLEMIDEIDRGDAPELPYWDWDNDSLEDEEEV